jgi:hypothetical protein
MGVKTGSGGMNILHRDVEQEKGQAGAAASKLAKAKAGGAGIGGLLGSVIGQILIPIPGVGAAIGGAFGSVVGSKVGGTTSGVSQDDILGGKFFQNTRANMAEGIAKSEFSSALKSAATGFVGGLSGGGISDAASAIKGGFQAGSEGLKGFAALGGGIKGAGSSLLKMAQTTPTVDAILSGDNSKGSILDITKTVTGGGADGGGGSLLSRAWGGVQDIFGGGGANILESFNPEDTDRVKQFQSKFMDMGEGDEGYGTFGPKTTEMFRSMN